MMRGLKVTMVVFGGILTFEGILDILFPVRRAAGMGLGDCAAMAPLPVALLGGSWLAAGIWTIVAARKPLEHPNWIKFAASFPYVLLLVLGLGVIRGDVSLQSVAIDMAFNLLFAVLFLIFYPRRSAS